MSNGEPPSDFFPPQVIDALPAEFKVTREQLPGLAYFLLGHALLDRWLIQFGAVLRFRAAAMRDDTISTDQVNPLLDQILRDCSRGAFARHLKAVQNHLPEAALRTCEEANRGRDHFLHWEPGRFEVPRYFSADVTTRSGFEAYMKGVLTAIRLIQASVDGRP